MVKCSTRIRKTGIAQRTLNPKGLEPCIKRMEPGLDQLLDLPCGPRGASLENTPFCRTLWPLQALSAQVYYGSLKWGFAWRLMV